MEMEGGSERAAVTLKRAEIDTAAPFRSVREAVTMFGHTQLVGAQPYPSKLNRTQMDINGRSPRDGDGDPWDLDVEETKCSLQKAREESLVMENRLSSLRQDLERTKTELQLLKLENGRQPQKQLNNGDDDNDEIESVEIVEDSAKQRERRNMELTSSDDDKEDGNDEKVEMISSTRYVSAAATILAQEMFNAPQARLERHPSLRRKKKKGLIPLIGAFFSKTKTRSAAHEVA